MTQCEYNIYVSMLEILKGGKPFNISAVARKSQVTRQTIYTLLEKRTFQDLEKYKNKK